MMQLVKNQFWFPGIHNHIKATTTTCQKCQVIIPGRSPFGFRPSPGKPFEEVIIDHKSSKCGKKILCIIDALSRYIYCEFVMDTSSKANRQALLDYFARFGTPTSIRSDNGSPFNSLEFQFLSWKKIFIRI